jgi:hypothetical protein
LLQRQAAIRNLKRRLREVEAALAASERHAIAELFQDLPDTSQFRDALAMEFRRASSVGTSLSGILLRTSNATSYELGGLARKIRAALRQGESLYRISDSALVLILPKMVATEVRFFAGQLESLGIGAAIELDLTMVSYPEEVSSLSELEAWLKGRS